MSESTAPTPEPPARREGQGGVPFDEFKASIEEISESVVRTVRAQDDLRERVGQAVWEAWMSEMVRQGWADHLFKGSSPPGKLLWECQVCRRQTGNGRAIEHEKHHPEMGPTYDALPPERRALYEAMGEAGWELAVYQMGSTEPNIGREGFVVTHERLIETTDLLLRVKELEARIHELEGAVAVLGAESADEHITRLVGERETWRDRAEQAEAKLAALGAEHDRLVEAVQGWQRMVKQIVNIYYEFDSEGDRALGDCLYEYIAAAESMLDQGAVLVSAPTPEDNDA